MTTRAREIENLYITERKRLESQIRRKTGCAATASDIVHDIFLRIWERATDRSGDSAAYLTRCARNAAIDHARAESRRTGFLAALVPEQVTAPAPTPLDHVIAREGLRSLDEAIAGLPERTRHIFLLNRIHGRTFTEIAAVLGISDRAVAKHMARAMAACESSLFDQE